jgi:hypothetical protein
LTFYIPDNNVWDTDRQTQSDRERDGVHYLFVSSTM